MFVRRLVALSLLAAGCAAPEPPPDRVASLRHPGLLSAPAAGTPAAATLGRQREPLLAALAATSTRAEALRGLGQVQYAADLPAIVPFAADEAPAVRAAAAEAIGLLGIAWSPPTDEARAAAATALATAAGKESDAQVAVAQAWALGRIGGPATPPALLALLGHEVASVREEAALSLGLVGRFHPPADPAPLVAALDARAGDASPGVRVGVAFALANLPHPSARAAAGRLARDAEPDARAFAARALGKVAEEPSLLVALGGDPVARVRVEAVRGLQALRLRGGAGGPKAEAALIASARRYAVDATRGQQALAALPLEQLLRPVEGEPPRAAAEGAKAALVADGAPAHLLGDLAHLRCLAAIALVAADGRPGAIDGCSGGRLAPDAEAIFGARALGRAAKAGTLLPEGRAALLALATTAPLRVRAEALAALGPFAATEPAARAALVAAFAEADPAVVGAAAEALPASPIDDPEQLRVRLSAALDRFAGPADVEPAASLVACLGKLLPQAPTVRARLEALLQDPRRSVRDAASLALGVPPPSPAPAQLPAGPAGAETTLVLETAKGTIRARLDEAAAPVAVENLRALVRRGFFDGLTFHRVEPGFVVQGGDPRGDGVGGPGWAIPCENGRTRYTPGTLGMALSGKDTGGSQLFFATARAPHLEGRYTAFGQATVGLDVLERLRAGDAVVKARLE